MRDGDENFWARLHGLRNISRVLGTEPMLGRTFYAEEDEPGGDRFAILTDRFWSSRFGRDPGVIGQRIFIEGESTEIVGVMGPDPHFPLSADLWVPARVTPSDNRGRHSFAVLARLAHGTILEGASASVSTIATALEAEYPDDNQGRGMWVQSLHEATVGDVRSALLALLGGVGFVLLIACANVGNLLVARAVAREPEIATALLRAAVDVRSSLHRALTEGQKLMCPRRDSLVALDVDDTSA